MTRYALALLALAAICPAQTSPPAHYAFYRDEVHEIRLTFSQSDWWDQLTSNYENNGGDVPFLEASLVWGPYSFAQVGVRSRPFRIKLDEYVKGQKIEGIGSFNLSNGWPDPALLRASWVRADFAALYQRRFPDELLWEGRRRGQPL